MNSLITRFGTASSVAAARSLTDAQRLGFGRRFVSAVSFGSVLNPVNSSIIAIALVAIGRSFSVGAGATAWLVLGGTALFLAGHALFKAVVWRTWPVSRLLGAVLLVALLPVASHLTAVTLAAVAGAVVVVVAALDRALLPPPGDQVPR